MIITSPCTGICKLDDATGWCLGCGRSGDEIAGWGMLPANLRDGVWAQIPERLQTLGVACRRLAWTTKDILCFVAESLQKGDGTWVMGVVGAVAEFTPQSGAGVEVSVEGDEIIAHTKNGAIRMLIDDDVRALTFDTADPDTPPRVVLAVKRERGRLPVAHALASLGPDTGALIPDDAGTLFDLGLGRKERGGPAFSTSLQPS